MYICMYIYIYIYIYICVYICIYMYILYIQHGQKTLRREATQAWGAKSESCKR